GKAMLKIGDLGMDGIARFFLYQFSIYVVPTVICIATIAAIFYSAQQSQTNNGTALALRVIRDDATEGLTVDRAMAPLSLAPKIAFQDTHLSEAPFWLLVDIPEGANA